jgi:hypothetical protein
MKIGDKIEWKAEWTIYKWGNIAEEIAAFLQKGGNVQDAIRIFGANPTVKVFEGNLALNEGLQELINIICGLDTPTKWDNTNARLGVGDSSTAADATQTGLLGANTVFKAMDTGYPQRSAQTAEWRATFAAAEGNFAWNEFTVDNGATANKNLNRKVESKGTKANGETWTLSVKVTFS